MPKFSPSPSRPTRLRIILDRHIASYPLVLIQQLDRFITAEIIAATSKVEDGNE